MWQTMMFIEADGGLHRGFGRACPALSWSSQSGAWTVSNLPTPQCETWGQPISPREAERLYPGSTTAPPPPSVEIRRDLGYDELVLFRPELFDSYDGPTFRESADEKLEVELRVRQPGTETPD